MRSHPSELGRRWRRFNRKHGLRIFCITAVLFIMAIVALIMYVLSNPDWRPPS